ncbi:lasso peptide biosynthesis PqqD family chaperone [Nocardia sp. NPDC001965]
MGELTLRRGLSFAETAYGGVILDMRRGDYWRLNPVGAAVVAALVADGGADPVAAITTQFEIDVTTARRDIDELLDRLRDLGLVVA